MDVDLCPFWNRKSLEPPALAPRKIISSNPSKTSVIIHEILLEAVKSLQSCGKLNRDGALLSRLIYRMKRVFRNDKGFKTMQKINQLLKRYLLLDLRSSLTSIEQCTYEIYGPSTQMMEWCLVNLMRFAALFFRLHALTEQTGKLLNVRLYTGHHLNVAIISLGVVSRLWSLSSMFLFKCCDWYKKLKSFLPNLSTDDGPSWLPCDESLPPNLKSWLGLPSYLLQKKKFLNKSRESRQEEDTITGDLLSKSGDSTAEPVQISSSIGLFRFNEDLGETLSRSSPPKKKKL